MISNNIQFYRYKASLTQEQLAEAVDKLPSTISNYENNKQIPSTKTLAKIALSLNVPLTCLLSDIEFGNRIVKFMESSNFKKIASENKEYQRNILKILQTLEDSKNGL